MRISRLGIAFLLSLVVFCSPAFAGMAGAAGGLLPAATDSAVWLTQEVTPADVTVGGAEAAIVDPHAGLNPNTFGHSVAVSGDFAVVGDPSVAVSGSAGQGAVFVFKREDGVWKYVTYLLAGDGAAGDGFGIAVAMDGATVVVGAYKKGIGGNADQGAAYVFKRQADGTWKQTAKLVAADGEAEDYFGFSVAVSGSLALVGSGAYRIVGGPDHYRSSAYVFTRGDDGSWVQTAKLQSDDSIWNDHFGYSLSLDGNSALIGAYGWQLGKGAAYVFVRGSNGDWTQTAKLMADDGAFFNDFAHTVSLDGNTAVVGAYNADVDGVPAQGSAYVFTRTNGTWAQSEKLVAEDGGAFDDFGQTVVISGDTILVSSIYATGYYYGAAYVFSHIGGSWVQTAMFTASDRLFDDAFGIGLAIDGHDLLIGSDRYAAYFYSPANVSLAVSAPQTVGQGQDYVSQAIVTNSATVTSPAVALTVAIPAAASFISASATQGSCMGPSAGSAPAPAAITGARAVVICNFGGIDGNAGTAIASLTFKAKGAQRTTIHNTASISNATPAVTAGIATVIVNNPPVASGGTLTTQANTAASSVLVATDPDGDALVFSAVTQPRYGKVTIDDPATGTFTYTPNKGYQGADSFTFKANDGQDDSNVATVLITVKDNPPVATDGTLTTEKNTAANGVLEGSDPDGGPLTFVIVTAPQHGTAAITNFTNGAYTYTPTDGYSGSDSFTFKVSDGHLNSNIATVTINVDNQAPVAHDSAFAVTAGGSVTGRLEASDPDGDSLSFDIASEPRHGTVRSTAYGVYVYTANDGYAGSDEFSFKANDGSADSNTATVSVTVTAATSPPKNDGGGGFVGWRTLLALLGMAVVGMLIRRWRG